MRFDSLFKIFILFFMNNKIINKTDTFDELYELEICLLHLIKFMMLLFNILIKIMQKF